MFLSPIEHDTPDDGHSCRLTSSEYHHAKHVEQLILLSSHVTSCHSSHNLTGCVADEADVRLLELFTTELADQPTSAAWLMLYHEYYDRMTRARPESLMQSKQAECTGKCTNGILVWGEQAIWRSVQ